MILFRSVIKAIITTMPAARLISSMRKRICPSLTRWIQGFVPRLKGSASGGWRRGSAL